MLLTTLTKHGVQDGKGDGGAARHSPAAAQVGEVCAQHLHYHLVVQGQIELLLIYELVKKERRERKSPLQAFNTVDKMPTNPQLHNVPQTHRLKVAEALGGGNYISGGWEWRCVP